MQQADKSCMNYLYSSYVRDQHWTHLHSTYYVHSTVVPYVQKYVNEEVP